MPHPPHADDEGNPAEEIDNHRCPAEMRIVIIENKCGFCDRTQNQADDNKKDAHIKLE